MSATDSFKISVSPYVPFHTLTGGHSDTVNALAFSPDGAYLASGGDDNTMIIWKVSEGRMLYRSMHNSAVDAIIWHPVYPETVIVGCEGGWLFQLGDFSLRGAKEHEIHLGARSTVNCLDYCAATRYLAVGLGDEVHITYEASRNVYRGDTKLPSPPDRQDLDDSHERRLRAVAVRFHKNGEQLIVSYMAHGIICWNTKDQTQAWAIQMPLATPSIGGSSLSPDSHDIVVYNLVDGLNCYSTRGKGVSRMLYKLDRNPRSNHHVKVCHIHGGDAIVCGTTTGNLCVWNAISGALFQLLPHSSDIVQAVSATMTSKSNYVAAGSAAKGQSTYIKVWKADIRKDKDAASDISDVMVDVVRAVTSNHLYQPRDGIRQGITIAITIAVCFAWFWAFTLVPWRSVWDSSVSWVHSSIEMADTVASFLREEGGVVWGYAFRLCSAAAKKGSNAWAVGQAWALDLLRAVLRDFLFPTNAAYRALDPAFPGDVPFRAGEF